MIINTFSYLWSASAVDAIEQLTEHGYERFEIPISAPHCWPDDMSAQERSNGAARLRHSGASIRSLNAGGYDINLASPGASMRRKSIEHIGSVVDLAGEWGATDVVISPGTRRPMISPSLELVYDWMYESLEQLVPMAKQAGVRLLFENTPYCFTPTIDDLVGVVETIGDEAVKIVYDVANAAYIGEDPVEAVRAHHAAIALMHISDTGTETWGHDPIGTGIIDWTQLGAAVDATIGVDNVVLEVIREERPVHEFDTAVRDLRAAGWTIAAQTDAASR